jgi:hypothetical protein
LIGYSERTPHEQASEEAPAHEGSEEEVSDEPIKHGLNELVALCIEYEVRKPGMAAAIAKIIDDCTDNRDVQIALLTRDLAAAREELAEVRERSEVRGNLAATFGDVLCAIAGEPDRVRACVIASDRFAEMRAQLAAANATVEKCKQVADNALDHTENAMDTDEALARCKAGLRNVITAAEAAREGKETT